MSTMLLRPGDELQFPFVNYRGERETRHVIFLAISYGTNAYYAHPDWFLHCWDIERGEYRGFVLSKIDPTTIVTMKTEPTP